jgi:hypothetical protein
MFGDRTDTPGSFLLSRLTQRRATREAADAEVAHRAPPGSVLVRCTDGSTLYVITGIPRSPNDPRCPDDPLPETASGEATRRARHSPRGDH